MTDNHFSTLRVDLKADVDDFVTDIDRAGDALRRFADAANYASAALLKLNEATEHAGARVELFASAAGKP